VFAVTIGPVNLWVLGRKRRRMWLLWTVPAISLATCLAIWVYAVAAEGFSADRRIETITILDQEHQTAATLGFAAYYAPLTPGGGLMFDPHTELTPQLDRRSRRNSGRSRTVSLTRGQNLDSGWVIARVPAHFAVRKPQINVRERLTVKRTSDGGSYRVTNGFGGDLLRVWYADDAGKVYAATGDANTPAARAGESVTLSAAPASTGRAVRPWRELYTQDWILSLDGVNRSANSAQAGRLAPHTYLAVLDGQPFIEPGLEGSDVRRERAYVLGIVGPATQNASNDTD